jgi:hypothetical protein
MGIHHDILGYLGGNTNNKPSIWGLLMDKNHDFGMFFFLFTSLVGISLKNISRFFSSGSDDSTIDVYGKRHHPPIAEVFLGW